MLCDALIDPLIAAAGDDKLSRIRQVLSHGLGKGHPRGSRDCEHPAIRLPACPSLFEDLVDRFAPYARHHHHSSAPAVGGVVNTAMTIMSPFAKITDPQVHEAVLARLAQQ